MASPDVTVWFDDITKHSMTTSVPGECVVCGERTDQINVDFESFLHAPLCLEIMWYDLLREG